jgi:hypothetical protein
LRAAAGRAQNALRTAGLLARVNLRKRWEMRSNRAEEKKKKEQVVGFCSMRLRGASDSGHGMPRPY